MRLARAARWSVAIEWSTALLLLLATAPVLFLAAVLIKLTSRGPVFYAQVRLGVRGSLFALYKLRTMRHNCERESGIIWSPSGDPRVTTIGRFLRRTHIDELPQLWNVLRGDMSLVGPRPERPEFLEVLEQAVPLYRSRLLVRPGMTGLAQVQLYADTEVAGVRAKLAYDLYYVRNASPFLDLKILFATAFRIIGCRFSTIRAIARLPRVEEVEQEYGRQLDESAPRKTAHRKRRKAGR